MPLGITKKSTQDHRQEIFGCIVRELETSILAETETPRVPCEYVNISNQLKKKETKRNTKHTQKSFRVEF